MELAAAISCSGPAVFPALPRGTAQSCQQSAASGACLHSTNSGAFHSTTRSGHVLRQLQSWKRLNALREENSMHGPEVGTASRQCRFKQRIIRKSNRSGQSLITCRSSASQEALPAPPETWPIEPPLEKVEHERYMYPADTLPGYVSHSKDPRVPVKHKTSHLRVRGAVGCGLCHWIGDICSTLKLDGWVKELDSKNMEIVASGPSTAIDWLVGTLYRHPPDAKVFQVVESPYYEPIEQGFTVHEIDDSWVQGGHEEMRGTETFDFFGEETMAALWTVMYEEPDRLAREAIEAEVRERERAEAEAEAELDRRLNSRNEDEEDPDLDLLSRALEDEEDGSGLDDLSPRSFRRIEAEQARRASVQKGGFFGLDDDSESELLGAGAMREEDLYREGGEGETEDDDSTLQMLIDSIAKTKGGAKRVGGRAGARSRGSPSSEAASGARRGGTGRDELGEEMSDEDFLASLAEGKRREAGLTGGSNGTDDFPTSPKGLGSGAGTNVVSADGVVAAVPEPKVTRGRGRPRKVKVEADGTSPVALTPDGAAAPKPKRGRRKQAAAESTDKEPTETADFG